jgi:hypothetical protein
MVGTREKNAYRQLAVQRRTRTRRRRGQGREHRLNGPRSRTEGRNK